MALKKPRAKRLKISTGDDRADGATSSYVRKSRVAQGKAALAVKTDEERRLEEALFGLDHSNSYDVFEAPEAEGMDWIGQKRREKLREVNSEEQIQEDEQDDEMQGMADDQVRPSIALLRYLWVLSTNIVQQLFFTDAPGPSTRTPVAESEGSHSEEEDEDDERKDSASEEDEDQYPSLRGKSSMGKKPLWHDPADADLSVSLQDTNRLRKLRKTAAEDVVAGAEYENRLRQQCVGLSTSYRVRLITSSSQIPQDTSYAVVGGTGEGC